MHRVRVGLIGLSSVFLLVALAAALLRVAGSDSVANGAATVPVTANAADAAPSEPLAQLGVVPGNVPPPEEGAAPPPGGALKQR